MMDYTTDPSNGGTTSIFSLKKRDLDASMAEKVGIKSDTFLPCLETGTLMGTVTQNTAKVTGLSTATKVVMGGGDVQLGAADLSVVIEGQVAVLGGSFWQQVVNIKSTVSLPSDMNIHVIEGLSQAEGITFFSGLIMHWFRDAFCDLEKIESKKRGVDTYQVLEEKARDVPVSSHSIVPIFSNAMKYGKWYHQAPAFLNLSIDPNICNKASMFRSLEENACIISTINLESIKAFTKLEVDEIVFAEGASKRTLWYLILSDVTGCTIHVPKVTEATALGAGIYPSLKVAAQTLVTWDKTYTPNLEHIVHYEELKTQWQDIYKNQLFLGRQRTHTKYVESPRGLK